jgi:hypothetical protein
VASCRYGEIEGTRGICQRWRARDNIKYRIYGMDKYCHPIFTHTHTHTHIYIIKMDSSFQVFPVKLCMLSL